MSNLVLKSDDTEVNIPAENLVQGKLTDKLTRMFIARLVPYFQGTKEKDRIKGNVILYEENTIDRRISNIRNWELRSLVMFLKSNVIEIP